MSASIKQLLDAKLDVLSVTLKDNKVITVDKDAPLQSVLEVLSQHDILITYSLLALTRTHFLSNITYNPPKHQL